MQRFLVVAFATLAYGWFLLDFAWAIAFLADIPVATTVDHGAHGPVGVAVAVDLALFAAFAVHHSVLARAGVKRLVTRAVPAGAERATYVLGADALLALVLWQWRPIDAQIWNVQQWRGILWLGYGLGWAVAVASTFMIDHWDLVGLRQAASRHYQPPTFQERWLYAWLRHPLMLGLLLAFWITPSMSAGHLLFAAVATVYIGIGVAYEERDLRRDLGEPYVDYARRIPALLPWPRRLRWSRRRTASQVDGATTGP